MIRYVVGLAFYGVPPLVVLQQKARPGWQHGRLNCPGGKANDDETGPQAMSREFHEETGLLIEPRDWDCFLTETARTEPPEAAEGWVPHTIDYYRYTFKTDQPPELMRRDPGNEPVAWSSVRQHLSDRFQVVNLIGNLQWVIPMALDWRRMRGHVLLSDDIRRKGTW
jgi:8-oxo-dGTP pyrophosphatase MutT (NUDIX family)